MTTEPYSPHKPGTEVHSERVKGRWPLCWKKFEMGERYTTSYLDDRVTCKACLEIMNG